MNRPPKLMLVVVDAMKPSMLHRAIETGRAPTLAMLAERGQLVDDCVSAFPSVTPTCAATIATGTTPDRHGIPSMNWFRRSERRYIEYGTSFKATQAFGFRRSLTDTIYNMNGEHLSRDVETVFETLDDAELRTAGTTYLMYRGRHEHKPARDSALTRVASTVFRQPVMGPTELFYADLFASQRTPCRSQLGLPGARDQHSGCVGAYMVEHDLFDFLLLSLPDNDTLSHRNGPMSQVASLAAADRQIERVVHAGGGPDAFLAEHAVIVVSDHSQSQVERAVDLFAALGPLGILPANGKGGGARIAVCPGSRSAMLYVLDEDERPALVPELLDRSLAVDGVDIAMAWDPERPGWALARSAHGTLRFRAGGPSVDERGAGWTFEGDPRVLDLDLEDGSAASAAYPLAPGRIWAALSCREAGDVLLSATPGAEFTDWGGADHVGGGSHGSLHASDSEGVLMWCGTGPEAASRQRWTIADVAPMVREHFGV